MSRENFQSVSNVTFAQFTTTKPKFIETSPSLFTRAQKEGLRYEKKVHEYLQKLLEKEKSENDELKISPWVMFKTLHDSGERIRFCQPDAVLISTEKRKLTIFEIKYQHTNEAWKQLRLLYEPVLSFMFPSFSVSCLEICRWFDPHIYFAEHYYYAEHPLHGSDCLLGVHIYNPQRK